MLGTFANMFRIPELRKKILFTLGILVIYRFGCLLPVPGVNTVALARVAKGWESGALGQFFGMVTILSGGALSRASVFALGIMPYISATIIFQLLTGVIPALERLRKEGESGLKKIRQYERYTTLGLCMIQGTMFVNLLRQAGQRGGDPVFAAGWVPMVTALTAMATGTMLLMWLGDQITQYGVGNGISLIIMAGIIARLPLSILHTYLEKPGAGTVIFLIAAFVFIVGGVVLITQGQRRIPVQQAKHTRGRRVYGGQRQYLPFRVNHAGVMPVIFASTLLIFPRLIAKGLANRWPDTWLWIHDNVFGGQGGSTWIYISLYVIMIYFFSYFWTSLMFKPKDISENLQDYGSFIPGIRPGRRTADYLENVMTHITLAGATFLAVVAILPQILPEAIGIGGWMAGFYGGTSVLIMVGVALDLVEKIESHLMMRHYEGFMRKGKIRGRR
ncbi:MAG TPA: preprotein translocase subunit SecY [Planctomycetota bacterium]|nr:preprotein translocase subunit SecY [Planctomycetota bacterium]